MGSLNQGQAQRGGGTGGTRPAGLLPAARGGGGRQVGPGNVGSSSAPPGVQDFLSSIGSGLNQQIATGFQPSFTGLEDALRGAADRRFDLRSNDIRERLGGLGLRFGTDVSNQMFRAATDTETDINAQLAPLAFQAQDAASGRRAGGIQTGLQLPGMFQGLIDAGETARLQPLTQAGAFGTGFAPVGTTSNSKSQGISVLGG